MFYNYDRICSYNCLLNMIITNRGYGKSYGIKKKVIQKFLKTGEQFIYIRRYKSELKNMKKKFFDDIKPEFPNVEFEVRGWSLYINKKQAGFLIPLSTSQSEKSNAYPMVTTIVFDEFLIDKSYIRYLDNEVEVLLDLVYTVSRVRNNVRCFMLGNNITSVNPYFTYFGINPKEDKRFSLYQDGELIVNYETSEEFIMKMKETKFGKLVKNTKYEEFAIENECLRDNKAFVTKLPISKCHPLFALSLEGQTVYIYWTVDLIYFSKQKTVMKEICLDPESHYENTLLIKKDDTMKTIVKRFAEGKCRFENQNIKELAIRMFQKIGYSY